jgi:hypothetical protein
MELTGNLLIIGDSFCQDKHHWPDYLRSHFTYPLNVNKRAMTRVAAFPGGGWWPIRRQITATRQGDPDWYKQLKLLIIIHPFKDRVFCEDQRAHQSSPVQLPLNWSAKDFDEATIAHSLYYKYLYDENFHIWAQVSWFNELAELLLENPQLSSIHLFADKDTQQLMARSKLSGIGNARCVPTTLMDVAHSQYSSSDNIKFMSNDGDHGFYNHLTPYNNIVFADQLYQIINSERDDFDLTQFKPYG